MHPPRYRLSSLLGVVAACGVGFAALTGGHLWFSGLFTLTIAGLLIAALGAMFRREPARAFFAGAALCGSAYLLLVYSGDTCHMLLTDKFLRAAADWPQFRMPPVLASSAPPQAVADYEELRYNRLVNWRGQEYRLAFEGVGHLLFSWLFAAGGGLVARTFAARTERERTSGSRPTEPAD
jgi:hypothetical protein